MCDHDASSPPRGSRDSRIYRTRYDPTGTTPLSTTVATSLADCADTDVDSCWRSLYDSIDPTALDALFHPRYDGRPRRGGTLSFAAAGHRITVRSDGHVLIEPAGVDSPS